MYALEVGFVIILIILFIAWLLMSKVFQKVGGFVMNLPKTLKDEDEQIQNKTKEVENK